MTELLLGFLTGAIACGLFVWALCLLQRPWLRTLRFWREIQEAKAQAAADDLRSEQLRRMHSLRFTVMNMDDFLEGK